MTPPYEVEPGERFATVHMLPEHFRAYQMWLEEAGLTLFRVPYTRPAAYAVTPTDRRADILGFTGYPDQ